MSSTTPIASYEQARAEHRWEVPARYNIAADVCDRHPRDKLAMVHEDFAGKVRRVSWGELQDDPAGLPTCSSPTFEVELACLEHPAVAEAAAVAAPDERRGNVVGLRGHRRRARAVGRPGGGHQGVRA
jgi:AMP-binding enzyme